MNTYGKRILITGGAGFIGSHLVRRFLKSYPNYLIVNLDKLTYAGNLSNLEDVENLPNYIFEDLHNSIDYLSFFVTVFFWLRIFPVIL